MNRTIAVLLKNVYGNQLIYPANDAARLATGLTQTKTLNVYDLARLMAMGFDVVVDADREQATRVYDEAVSLQAEMARAA